MSGGGGGGDWSAWSWCRAAKAQLRQIQSVAARNVNNAVPGVVHGPDLVCVLGILRRHAELPRGIHGQRLARAGNQTDGATTSIFYGPSCLWIKGIYQPGYIRSASFRPDIQAGRAGEPDGGSNHLQSASLPLGVRQARHFQARGAFNQHFRQQSWHLHGRHEGIITGTPHLAHVQPRERCVVAATFQCHVQTRAGVQQEITAEVARLLDVGLEAVVGGLDIRPHAPIERGIAVRTSDPVSLSDIDSVLAIELLSDMLHLAQLKLGDLLAEVGNGILREVDAKHGLACHLHVVLNHIA
mmetsp:Transcript_60496/g.173499  ORF Transcript_60496/g.173499 Transcript_60496/m.173499 type:complete len:298 (-) Transcript_60496:1065-1958(-)